MARLDIIAQLSAALAQQQTYIDQISDGKPINEETYRQMSNLSGQAHAAARALVETPGENAPPNFISLDPESLATAVRNRHRSTSWVVNLARHSDEVTQERALQALLLLRNDGIFRIREMVSSPRFLDALVRFVRVIQVPVRAKLSLELLFQISHNRVEEFKNAVVDANGIDAALHVVQQNVYGERELAIRLLHNLASDGSIHHATMREKGVLEVLVGLVNGKVVGTLAQMIIQKRLIETLRPFVIRRERWNIRDSHLHTPEQNNCIRVIVTAGAIQKLVDLFRAAKTQPTVMNEAALLLAELSETDFGKKGFCLAIVPSIGMACVNYLEGTGTLMRGVCRLIFNLASENSTHRFILSESKLIKPLMDRARAVGADKSTTRSLAMHALVGLTTCTVQVDKAIVESVIRIGGVDVGMYALTNPGQDAKEFINAGNLLTNLVNNRVTALAIVRSGAVERCEGYAGDENGQQTVTKLLGALTRTLAKPTHEYHVPSPGDDNKEAVLVSAPAAAPAESRKRTRSAATR